jgi:hypothetical protein
MPYLRRLETSDAALQQPKTSHRPAFLLSPFGKGKKKAIIILI